MPMLAAPLLGLLLAANPALDEGRTLFQKLQYEQALVKLKSAAESSAPGAERREAYDLLARTWAALGDLSQTEAVYAQLLAKDPRAPAPADAAPKIRAAYSSAKTSLFPPGTVRLTRVGGAERHLKLELFDPWSAVAKLELHEDDGTCDRAKPLAVKPALELTLAPQTQAAWVLALGAKGEPLASLGSKTKPLRFARTGQAPPPPAPPPANAEKAQPKPAPEAAAQALLAEGRDAEALQAVASARASGALAREAVLALLGIEACASARLGDGAHAELAYRKAFAVNPQLPAPDACEEGWTAWFAARDASRKEALDFHALPLEPGAQTKATVERRADPLGVARSVRFHLRRSGGWDEREAPLEGDRATVTGPAGVLGWWAEVLGEGGTLLSLGSPTAPLSPAGEPEVKPSPAPQVVIETEPAPEAPEPPRKRTWGRSVGVGFAVVGVLLGGGAGAVGFAAERDRKTLDFGAGTVSSISQRDAFSLAERQRTEASVANTMIGFAIAAAVISLAFFLFAPGGLL